MEYSAKTRLPLHSTGIIYSSPPLRITLHFGIIFTLIHLYHRGESKKGSQNSPFLAISAKGGEILSPKQKDRTTTLRNFLNDIFQIVMFVFNWYI
jgi:hypothetical protein